MNLPQTKTSRATPDHATENPNELFLLSKAIKAVDSGMMITDKEGQILWVNPAFSKSIGYSPEDILGKTPSLFKSGKHNRNFYRRFWDTILRGETWRGQFVNRRKDGSFCVHSQTTTPMCRDSSGAITHFISISEETISRKKIRDTPADDQNTEIAVQLAAGIAHHLNNQLTVIHCNTEVLLSQNDCLDCESRDLLQQTLTASDRAAHFIRELVGYSRSQMLEFQPLDLNQVVESCLNVFRRNVKAGVEWKSNYCANLPPVRADSILLVQMISNVVLNALDAMPAGGKITLTTEKLKVSALALEKHPSGRAGEFICLTIQDTGCGMPPALLSHIFEPFFTTKNVGDRCGLGLSVVNGTLKQHQGWSEIYSQVGYGTTFKIFLPAITKPFALEDFRQKRLSNKSAPPSSQPEQGMLENFAEEPGGAGDSFSPDEMHYVPINHWGINE